MALRLDQIVELALQCFRARRAPSQGFHFFLVLVSKLVGVAISNEGIAQGLLLLLWEWE